MSFDFACLGDVTQPWGRVCTNRVHIKKLSLCRGCYTRRRAAACPDETRADRARWAAERKARLSPEQKRLEADKALVQLHDRLQCPIYEDARRMTRRAKAYGVTVQWLYEQRARQKGACAICTAPMTTDPKQRAVYECVDHSHETGLVRALLCATCNTALGLYEKRQRPAGLRIDVYEQYGKVYK